MKKVLAFLLCLVMCIPTVSALASDTKLNKITDVLEYLEIMSRYGDGDFKADDNLTRAEAVTIMIRIMNADKNVEQSETPFSDVDITHWASGYINLAVEKGIINGMGDGAFEPDRLVTYSEFIKMIICVMRFDSIGELYGGWTGTAVNVDTGETVNGYVFAALSFFKIIDKIPADCNMPIKRGECAEIIYKTLNTEMMDDWYYWWYIEGGIEYASVYYQPDMQTVLEYYQKYQEIECFIKSADKNKAEVVVQDTLTDYQYKKDYHYYKDNENVVFETIESLEGRTGSIVKAYVKKTDDKSILLMTVGE